MKYKKYQLIDYDIDFYYLDSDIDAFCALNSELIIMKEMTN